MLIVTLFFVLFRRAAFLTGHEESTTPGTGNDRAETPDNDNETLTATADKNTEN